MPDTNHQMVMEEVAAETLTCIASDLCMGDCNAAVVEWDEDGKVWANREKMVRTLDFNQG